MLCAELGEVLRSHNKGPAPRRDPRCSSPPKLGGALQRLRSLNTATVRLRDDRHTLHMSFAPTRALWRSLVFSSNKTTHYAVASENGSHRIRSSKARNESNTLDRYGRSIRAKSNEEPGGLNRDHRYYGAITTSAHSLAYLRINHTVTDEAARLATGLLAGL